MWLNVFVTLYLVEETVMSYLDVRRRVGDSLKHVYVTQRPKGAQCPVGPRERINNTKILFIIVINITFFSLIYK